ncbi:MAG: hypothetical protein K9N51_02460 [Candidatus Pacebacteria bacterium]|nr:hypothetical protein [Candidatus Paceibacterota bacterium]
MAINYGSLISGAARTDNINASGQPLDMEAQTALLDPNSYRFLAIVRAIGSEIAADRMKHEYRERRLIPNFSEVTEAAAVGATTVKIKDYTRCHEDGLLYYPKTNQLTLITSSTFTTTSITQVLASDGSSGLTSAIAAGDKVIIMPEAHAEGEAIPTAFTNDSVDVYDYLMQVDRVVQATDIEEAESHYDPTEKLDADRRLAFIEYQRDRNVLFYVGQRAKEVTTANGRRRYCMGGVFEKFSENNFDLSQAGSGFTRETLANILGATKYKGASSETKIALFGVNGWRAISSWPVDALRVSPNDKVWGVEINRILTGFGALDVGYDPVLSGENGLADRGIVFDGAHVKGMYLRTKPVRMLTNIGNTNDIHNTTDAITGTFGLQAKFPELHAQLQGIQ